MLGSNFALLVKSPGDDGQQLLTTLSRLVCISLHLTNFMIFIFHDFEISQSSAASMPQIKCLRGLKMLQAITFCRQIRKCGMVCSMGMEKQIVHTISSRRVVCMIKWPELVFYCIQSHKSLFNMGKGSHPTIKCT